MKRVGFLLAGLLCLSVMIYAGEVISNGNTGEDATGLRVSFSTPVLITAFGDILTSVDPQMLSFEFVFSGGTVTPWESHWFNYAPTTAHIIETEWLQSATPSSWFQTAAFGDRPQVPEDIAEILYGYLEEPRMCCGAVTHSVPVYISIPPSTPLTDSFELEIEGSGLESLVRIDEVILVGAVSPDTIPAFLRLRILQNSVPVTEWQNIALENGFQAITIPLKTIDHLVSQAELPAEFLKAAMLTDVWGTYFYGFSREGLGGVHTRDFFDPTCQRLAEDGFTDVYIVTTNQFAEVSPLPVLVMGEHTMAISEADLAILVDVAHAYDLRVHLIFFTGVTGDVEHLYLAEVEHSDEWLVSLFSQHDQLMQEQALIASKCGVDALVLGFHAIGINYEGHPDLWYDLWAESVAEARQVWPGHLEFSFGDYGMMCDLLYGMTGLQPFNGIDSFLVSTPGWAAVRPDSHANSLETLWEWHRDWMVEQPVPFARLVDRPVYLMAGPQSTDGYMVDGWFDVAVGRLGNTQPDFFEQSRIYESILLAIADTSAFEGLVVTKYHWDDPFGPDFDGSALARMDLSASVRNKPAEAVLKRWFQGTAGPSIFPSEEASWVTGRPWCPVLYSPWTLASSADEHPVSDFAASYLGKLTWSTLPLQTTWDLSAEIEYGLYSTATGPTSSDAPDARFNGEGINVTGFRAAMLVDSLAFYIEFGEESIPSADNFVAYVLEFEPEGQEVSIVPIQNELSVASVIDNQWEHLLLNKDCVSISNAGIGIVLPYSLISQFIPPLESDAHYEVRLRVSYRGHESHGYISFPESILLGELPQDGKANLPSLGPAEEVQPPPQDAFERAQEMLGGNGISQILGSLQDEILPSLLGWSEDVDISCGAWFSDATAAGQTDCPDPRFNDSGWRIRSLRGAVLPEGMAFSLDFQADDQPSRDERVEYVVKIGADIYIWVRPIVPTCGLVVIANNEEHEVLLPYDFFSVSAQSIQIAIPNTLLLDLGLSPNSLADLPVQLEVVYRGREIHGFIYYPGEAELPILSD